ncbi:MAG: hypothetical protein HY235_14365 [Acidobacteria bacterium]|nr:hypothetical protein [Acidobacteriota bacterium]
MRFLLCLLVTGMYLPAVEENRNFTGVITDDMCKKNHTMMNITPDAKCIRTCVSIYKSKYALADGKDVYRLSDQQMPEKFAGQKVVVTGVLYEKTKIIKVESIRPAK